ncbi:DNA-directed RNA polymerase subunit delta [Desemzia sp. C1]|uniref:DNA-directed RNA polymerase subunit delta n=1 Tax=Desemzia sp. C1 TaxID=2892016 RepID=UPI001E296FC6|nr:DNA-directed RNA polymerase subunit delta [Desemzia sp. C1]MCI3028944.1 DNA-directed RNA polymerase subunit delta [Desemzia sp. C1]
MELKQFDGQIRSELSMIEVAHAILEQKGEVMDFSDLLKEIIDYLNLSDEKVEREMTQFYTDLNIDGSFISLGDNRWGLRSWYPIDSIDEELTHDNDNEDERPRRRKKSKTTTYGEDEIDYNADDPEDSDEYEEEEIVEDEEEEKATVYGGRVDVSDHGVMIDEEDEEDLGEYKEDLSAIGADDDDEEDELPDGVEGDLTLIEDDEEEEEEF